MYNKVHLHSTWYMHLDAFPAKGRHEGQICKLIISTTVNWGACTKISRQWNDQICLQPLQKWIHRTIAAEHNRKFYHLNGWKRTFVSNTSMAHPSKRNAHKTIKKEQSQKATSLSAHHQMALRLTRAWTIKAHFVNNSTVGFES